MASLDDYAVVRDLIADLVADGVEATVKATVRETVEAVADLAGENGATQSALARHLKLDRSSSKRGADQALSSSYLWNLEERRGRPARLVLGDPLPDDVEILPTAERLRSCCKVVRGSEGVETPLPPRPSSRQHRGCAQPGRPVVDRYGEAA